MASDKLQRVVEAQRTLIELVASASTPEEGRTITRDFLLETYELPLPNDVVVDEVDADGISAVWLRPPAVGDAQAILYLHGGGYMMGSVEESQETLARIGRAAGTPVLAVRYRLAPEHPFPAAVDDAVAAYRWLVSGGTRPDRIVVLGDSAGGGLALALVLRLRDAGEALPTGVVLLSPFTDLAATGATLETNSGCDPVVSTLLIQTMAAAYLQGHDVMDPYASPLYGDLTGLPPLLIQVGTSEGLLDDARRIAERGRGQGVDVRLKLWKDMLHQWQFYPWLPEAHEATAEIVDFIQERIAHTARV